MIADFTRQSTNPDVLNKIICQVLSMAFPAERDAASPDFMENRFFLNHMVKPQVSFFRAGK